MDYLHEHILAEFKRKDTEVKIDKFTSGQEFLNAHKDNPFDVVFLDIDIPEISGFDIAEKISDNERTLLIFVTTYDELVFSSLKFQLFRFIRKAYLDNEIGETVKAVNSKITKHISNQRIRFQTKENEIYVFADRIEYIEV